VSTACGIMHRRSCLLAKKNHDPAALPRSREVRYAFWKLGAKEISLLQKYQPQRNSVHDKVRARAHAHRSETKFGYLQ